MLMNPKRLPAQAIPSLLYICMVKRGKIAPKVYRRRPFAAIADAAFKA